MIFNETPVFIDALLSLISKLKLVESGGSEAGSNEEISVHLLHSDFDKAVASAKDAGLSD